MENYRKVGNQKFIKTLKLVLFYNMLKYILRNNPINFISTLYARVIIHLFVKQIENSLLDFSGKCGKNLISARCLRVNWNNNNEIISVYLWHTNRLEILLTRVPAKMPVVIHLKKKSLNKYGAWFCAGRILRYCTIINSSVIKM